MLNDTLFSWHLLDAHCDLTSFTMVIETMGLDDFVHQINQRRRKLARNPSLMRACGFEHYGDGFNDIDYRVPSKSAFSRFIACLLEVKRETAGLSQMAYHGVEKTRQTLKYHGPAAHYGFECLGRKQCYRDAGTPNSRCRVVRVKFDENNLRTIGTLPRNTYQWKRLYSARNALERINARSARDFNTHHH